MNLTKEQLNAITFLPSQTKTHLVIEAGAGAGKTKVLSERVKWLLSEAPLSKRISPNEIFLVTFTNDAQKELKERIQLVLLNKDLNQFSHMIHISTIDGLFDSLVDSLYPLWWEDRFTSLSEMPPLLTLVSESEVSRNLEKHVTQFLNHSDYSPHQLALVIDFILSGGFKKSSSQFYTPTNTLENILKCMCQDHFLTASIEKLRIVSHKIHPATNLLISKIHSIARNQYEQRIQKGEFTYADKTVFLKENLKDNCPIFIKELIVDEYQDTNFLQHEILYKLIQNSKGRMVVVGDPKQSIYGFRGASVGVFKSLLAHTEWKHIELNKNFRTQPKLLNEINSLSKLAFGWQNPRLPAEYINSFFYEEAQKKYIGENPLTAGILENNDIKSPEYIHIVSASIPSKTKNKSYAPCKMNIHSPLAYAHFLLNFKEQENINWSDIVVLCEKNNQIQTLKEAFLTYNIPVKTPDIKNNNSLNFFEDNVALALVKCLAGKENQLDIYTIFKSPLLNITEVECSNYFSINKKSCINIDKFFSKLEKYKNIACHYFFYAWQNLRWDLIDKSNFNSQIFCAQMDSFADVLYSELLNYNTRLQIENSIFNNDAEFILSQDINAYSLIKKEQLHNTSEDALEIKTIHKAKGLEWPYVCFYPKYGMNLKTGEFITSQSAENLDISWLNQDTEGLSVVKRVENHNFNLMDSIITENNKSIRFAEIRKEQEENYERQRVFYTAFTRPQNKLILFQPTLHHSSKKGLKELCLEKKETQYKDYLEQDIYVKYINEKFHFSIQNDSNIPASINETFFSKDKMIKLTQYNLAELSYNLPEKKEALISLEEIKDVETNFNFIWSQSEELHQPEENYDHNILDVSKNTIQNCHKILNLIQSKKEQRLKKHKGILYHTAIENHKKPTSNTISNLVNKALYSKRELEIWTQNSRVLNSNRNIIDMLLVFKKNDFLISQDKAYVALVIDFKTGQTQQSHVDQILNYKSLIRQIFDVEDNFAVYGALVYNVINFKQNIYHNNELLTPFSTNDQEIFYLFS